jgi:hypothetical protein
VYEFLRECRKEVAKENKNSYNEKWKIKANAQNVE